MPSSFFNKLFSKKSDSIEKTIIKILENSVDLQQAGSLFIEKNARKLVLQNVFHTKGNSESVNIYFFLEISQDMRPLFDFIDISVNGKSLEQSKLHYSLKQMLMRKAGHLADKAFSAMSNKDLVKMGSLEEQGQYGCITLTNYVRFDR